MNKTQIIVHAPKSEFKNLSYILKYSDDRYFFTFSKYARQLNKIF